MNANYKIEDPEAILWILAGLVLDLISLVPILNILIAIVFFCAFQFYLIMKGIGFKRRLWSAAGSLIEVIPVLSVLPAITGSIVATIIIDRTQGQLKRLKPKSK